MTTIAATEVESDTFYQSKEFLSGNVVFKVLKPDSYFVYVLKIEYGLNFWLKVSFIIFT